MSIRDGGRPKVRRNVEETQSNGRDGTVRNKNNFTRGVNRKITRRTLAFERHSERRVKLSFALSRCTRSIKTIDIRQPKGKERDTNEHSNQEGKIILQLRKWGEGKGVQIRSKRETTRLEKEHKTSRVQGRKKERPRNEAGITATYNMKATRKKKGGG